MQVSTPWSRQTTHRSTPAPALKKILHNAKEREEGKKWKEWAHLFAPWVSDLDEHCVLVADHAEKSLVRDGVLNVEHAVGVT